MSNDEVARRGGAPTTSEADLSRSSYSLLGSMNTRPCESLEPMVRWRKCHRRTASAKRSGESASPIHFNARNRPRPKNTKRSGVEVKQTQTKPAMRAFDARSGNRFGRTIASVNAANTIAAARTFRSTTGCRIFIASAGGLLISILRSHPRRSDRATSNH
jgi:hypothetical protein